jgi:hypothetical protein
MEKVNLEINDIKCPEEDKKQRYRDYQRQYHTTYRLHKKLEDGNFITKTPMRRLKNKIGEFLEEEIKIKLVNLENQLQDRKHKQMQYMKMCIKLIQHNPDSQEFHNLIDKLEEMEELQEIQSLDKKIEYYEEILDGL